MADLLCFLAGIWRVAGFVFSAGGQVSGSGSSRAASIWRGAVHKLLFRGALLCHRVTAGNGADEISSPEKLALAKYAEDQNTGPDPICRQPKFGAARRGARRGQGWNRQPLRNLPWLSIWGNQNSSPRPKFRAACHSEKREKRACLTPNSQLWDRIQGDQNAGPVQVCRQTR